MEKFIINGGKPLNGEVNISGAKNAALAIIPATILCDEVCRIENVPNIVDVELIANIMRELGATVTREEKSTLVIDTKNINTCKAVSESVRKMRASYYLFGVLLGRFRHAEIAMPGGCNFGIRPIDQHIKGFEAMGGKYKRAGGAVIVIDASEGLKGAKVNLDVVSVGATMNIMLAAVKANGKTVIENAAKEPHIVDLANFLNSMGANIRGAGTDVIKITGVNYLHGATYSIIPDQIEAGTYMAAAVATRGRVCVKNVTPKHLESIVSKLREIGVDVCEMDDYVCVDATGTKFNPCKITTMPHPGFPTDCQPQFVALLCTVNGISNVIESVWDNRYQYVPELISMGANISVSGKMAVINGGTQLYGVPVKATDLRAGAALVIAGLVANGTTEVSNITYIERGYEEIVNKLVGLGADIKRVVE